MIASLGLVWAEINELIVDGFIEIDGTRVELDFYLSGDYKFLLMSMVLNKASSDYACLWCDLHKDDRSDMTKPKDYYESEPRKRTIEKLQKLYKIKLLQQGRDASKSHW